VVVLVAESLAPRFRTRIRHRPENLPKPEAGSNPIPNSCIAYTNTQIL